MPTLVSSSSLSATVTSRAIYSDFILILEMGGNPSIDLAVALEKKELAKVKAAIDKILKKKDGNIVR